MNTYGVFDILGPIMIGPSSSHTAGAARLGKVARAICGKPMKKVTFLLHGSFGKTYKGHGTDKALVAGILGMEPSDTHLRNSLEIAKEKNIEIEFKEVDLGDAHPNTVQLCLIGQSGRQLEVVGESIGGARINIAKIDGIETNFSGDYPTLVVHNLDQPGHIAEVTSMLAHKSVNIATMQLYRSARGGEAVMVVECDQEIPKEGIDWLKRVEGIKKVTYLSAL